MKPNRRDKGNKLRIIEKRLIPAIENGTSITIVDTRTLTRATENLSVLNDHLDKIETEEDKVLKPLKQAIKAEQARWKPVKDRLKAAIDVIRLNMTVYQTNQAKLLQLKEDSMARRIEANEVSLDDAVDALEQVDKPVDRVSTAVGSLSFRSTQRLKIIASSDIPDEYWDLNESRVLADLKAGKVIPGAEIEIIQTPINRR